MRGARRSWKRFVTLSHNSLASARNHPDFVYIAVNVNIVIEDQNDNMDENLF